MELLVFYVVPAMTADQKKCEISYDLCFLHSADMYYYDTFMTYWSSIKTALTTTIICLLIGYPTAYAISRAGKHRLGRTLAIHGQHIDHPGSSRHHGN